MNIKDQITSSIPKDVLVKFLPRLQAEKTKSFMTVVFTLTSTAIFSFFAISPTLSTIADLNKQIDDSKFIQKKLEEKIASMSTLQQQYIQIKADIPTIEESIPTTPDAPSFVGKIQSIALDTQSDLVRIQTFPIEVTDSTSPISAPYSSFAFDLDVSGSSTSLSSFLDKLLSLDRLITIDGFSFAKASQTDNLLRLNIKGKLYFKKT